MRRSRKKTGRIRLGNVDIGGGAPVRVQSMTNTKTDDIKATIAQIRGLEEAGCEIIRVAVPDENAALAIKAIKDGISIPLVADIHFNYRLAIASLEAGADGLRINPGNIGSERKIKAVVDCAKLHNAVIRVGVNAGSLEKRLLEEFGGPAPAAMVKSALEKVGLLEGMGFYDIKVSLKASDVFKTIEAYRIFSDSCDYPTHVGVTEAGGLYAGIVKSSIGIGSLLSEGIGDTIRVSLTRDPSEEVLVGYEILKALGIRRRGAEIVSCPTCGRCTIDLFSISEKVEKALMFKPHPIKVAIMGCVVNGPGEARDADIGIAGQGGSGVLFKKGEVVSTFPEDQLVERLLEGIDEMIGRESGGING